eukprot:CAMPEP_0116056454 /NCGR_PEP_ID=MMETSP0322-20121206/4029_1 /TAXON_ID=163516 /ORGANISM="Leptocylindrus danicus var. apora, Strain B651" /LENGTH=533 /DNA_ID=CAMNT_0003540285 /DNA_START=36 /DNA_END=1637 /DNA_ORIENTATION=+
MQRSILMNDHSHMSNNISSSSSSSNIMRKRTVSSIATTLLLMLPNVSSYGLTSTSNANVNANVNGGVRLTNMEDHENVITIIQHQQQQEEEDTLSYLTSPPSTVNDEEEEDVDAQTMAMMDQVSTLGLPSLRDGSTADVNSMTEQKQQQQELRLQNQAIFNRQQRQQQPNTSTSTSRRRLMGKKTIPRSQEGTGVATDVSNAVTSTGTTVGKIRSNLRIESHEEEIELARAIQLGAKVNILKSDLEAKLNRSITKMEWAEAAGFSSASKLRRVVSDYRKAKNKLVMANMGLVHAVVKGNWFNTGEGRRRNGNAASYDELVQEGSLGLLRAAELFDPERGLRFSTYATIWIKGMLSNTKVHELITIPARERTKINKIREASASLAEMNLEGTTERIADITGFDEETVKESQMRSAMTNTLSLDYAYGSSRPNGDVQETTLMSNAALVEHNDAAEMVELQADILSVLTRNLKPKEAEFITLRYGIKDGNSYTLTECAKMIGVSYSRAQQLSKSCIKKLQKADEAKALQEYLLTLS